MTMRSKQWYTKTSRLWNSFANNSIGRLLDRASATRSSARRPVESNRWGGSAPGRRGVPRGEETAGFVPLGLRLTKTTKAWHRPHRPQRQQAGVGLDKR